MGMDGMDTTDGWDGLGQVLRTTGNRAVLAKFVAHSVALLVLPIVAFLSSYAWWFAWVMGRGWIPGVSGATQGPDEVEAMRVVFSVVAGVGALLAVLASYVAAALSENGAASQGSTPPRGGPAAGKGPRGKPTRKGGRRGGPSHT